MGTTSVVSVMAGSGWASSSGACGSADCPELSAGREALDGFGWSCDVARGIAVAPSSPKTSTRVNDV